MFFFFKRYLNYYQHRSLKEFLVIALLFLLLDLNSISAQSNVKEISETADRPQDVRLIEPGQTIERELAGGEAHAYQIQLAAGQYLHVTVEQRGIDAVLLLSDSDGKHLTEMDGLSGLIGAEELSWEAVTNGEYKLEVQAKTKEANPGRYQAQIEKTQLVNDKNRARIVAEQLFMQGRRAHAEGSGFGLGRAAKIYKETILKWREAGERKWEGQTLNNLGTVYWSLSQYEWAREHYEQALLISREIKDRRGEGATLYNLGIIYKNLSQYERAREYYEQALGIRREIKDRRGEGLTLAGLGNLYKNLSQYERACEYHEQALLIDREIKDRRGEGVTLHNLGGVYGELNEHERARDYYEQSLVIKRAVKDKYGEGLTLDNLGNVYRELSQYERAREHYEQALSISREIKNRGGEAAILDNLGITYADLNQYEQAREYHEKALAIRRETKDRRGEGITLHNLGNVYRNLRQYERAREYYEQALSISREINDRNREGHTRYEIACFELALGDLTEARSQIEAVLAIIESLHTTIISQNLRSSYFAYVQDGYELYIDVLMQLHKQHPSAGHNATALQISERARARNLLELLIEARANIRQGVNQKLIERERQVQRELNTTAQQQTDLLRKQHSPEQAAALAKEIRELTSEYEKLQTQIRQSSPRYAAITRPQPLNLTAIQQLLDSQTLLLQYSLGKERSYVWAVTANSLTSYELPPRAQIEAQAKQSYELLTARNRRAPKETPAQFRQRIAQAEADYPRVVAALSEMIVAPVAAQLKQLKPERLVVVADGALQYVPISALPFPENKTQKTNITANQRVAPKTTSELLVERYEVVSLPSASTLVLLRQDADKQQRAAVVAQTKIVAVLADPVFDKTDARVGGMSKAQRSELRNQQAGTKPQTREQLLSTDAHQATQPISESTVRDVERAMSEVGAADGTGRIARLPFSRREAEAIFAAAPAGGLKALDFEAKRETVVNGNLSDYRIVHFATHGLLNSEHPELSGIVLSLVDQQGKAQNGFLRLHEIYNLNLSAELVVLSACQTALGKEVRGEGLISLTRGFMYAGSPRVVASLWKVDDRATAELMKRFYQAMFKDKLRPAAALRAAKVSMSQERQWQPPYYWAAFELQGEWK